MKCKSCNKKIISNYGSGRFCDQKCARAFSTSEKRLEINNKVSRKLRKFTDEQLIKAVPVSNSYRDVARYLGYNIPASGGAQRLIKKSIAELNLNINHFHKEVIKRKYKDCTVSNKIELNKILIQNSSYKCTDRLKKRLLKENYLEDKCSLCGQIPIWNKQKLVLQLDHINGINNDHRIENLRIICPNCHTQTETYAAKNKKNKCGCSQAA